MPMTREEATQYVLALLQQVVQEEVLGTHYGDIMLIREDICIEIHCEVFPPED